jgi:hypothetical protein
MTTSSTGLWRRLSEAGRGTLNGRSVDAPLLEGEGAIRYP